MLIGLLANGSRVEAAEANKANQHLCPGCKVQVTLAQGRIRRAYFAHRPGSTCVYADGETKEHQEAKEALLRAFRGRGLSSDVEVEVLSIDGDRRADVIVHSPRGATRVAVEIQHSPLLFPSLEARTKAYISAETPVVWVAILPTRKLNPERIVGTNLVRSTQYAAPVWQRWMHDYHGHLWFYQCGERKLWRGWFRDHFLYQNESSWFEDGDERTSPGGWYPSERWRDLYLEGPFDPKQVLIRRLKRVERKLPTHVLPGGISAEFVVSGEPVPHKLPLRSQRIDHPAGYCTWQDQVWQDGEWRAARFEVAEL